MKLFVKSEAAEISEDMRTNCRIKGNSLAMRGLVYGTGINDADYVTYMNDNGVETRCPAYTAWRSMLHRAYSKAYHNKKPTYKDVTVCNEWLIFSNFRKWFIENYRDGYELDKDLLVIGNRVYSPENCIYVTPRINGFILNNSSRRGKHKIGVHWSKTTNKFTAQCNNVVTKKKEQLGQYTTEDAAHLAWLKRKLEIALELKPEMDAIDLRIYPNVVEIIKNMK